MSDFVTVEGRALAKAMKIANSLIEKSNIPILGCVLLSYSKASLIIHATDLDLEIKIDVDVIDGNGEWSACLNARTLGQIASVAKVAPMRIEKADTIIIVVNDGTAVYDLGVPLPASDWPKMMTNRSDLIESFTNGMLSATIKKVAWAVSTEETRYYLNGVAWQSNERGHSFVATDGHRLAMCQYSSEATGSWSRIIPRKTVALIDRFFRGLDVQIFATEKETAIDILAPGISMRAKLIDGTFPDFNRVIPKEKEFSFSIKTGEFIDAIRQATAIGGERIRGIRFVNDGGYLTLERKSHDFGSAKVKTSMEWPAGAENFGFNGQYIAEIIASCVGNVVIDMKDKGSPFIVRDEDSTMTRVLMPMRV